MYTDERIHIYCHDPSRINNNNNNGIHLQDTYTIADNSKASQFLAMEDNYVNIQFYMQNQLNDEIKDSSIKLMTSYLSRIFEFMKMINRYWSKIFNISNI